MAAHETFEFAVEILDPEKLRRGIGANALAGGLEIFDRLANVELAEYLEKPLVRIGGHDFPGRVSLAILGNGATLAVVQTWDMPRPAKFQDMPDAAELSPTMADDFTGVSAYILAHAYTRFPINRVVAEIWDRNLTESENDAVDALPLLLSRE